jgi:hypothetical protein
VITGSIIIMLRQSGHVRGELDLSWQQCVTVYNVSTVCDFHGMFISTSKYVSRFLMLKIIVTIKDHFP